MYFRQLLNDESACASYLLGCKTHSKFAVVDPHVDLVDEYIALADAQGVPIVAVLDTHVQADHVSGLPELVRRTGATAYLPEGAGVDFEHHALADGEVLELGNTEIQAIATPGAAAGRGGRCGQSQRPAARRGAVSSRPTVLGLRENLAQFSLLVGITAFVGAMVGLERSTLPLIGRQDFGLTSNAAVLLFLVT